MPLTRFGVVGEQGNGADRPQSAFQQGLDPAAAGSSGLHGGVRRTRIGCKTGGRQLIADPLGSRGGFMRIQRDECTPRAGISLACFIAAAVVMSSCATAGGYEKVLNSWMGADVSRLIESWGPPTSTYALPDGRTMYTWESHGGAVAVPVGNMAVAVPRTCKTTFTVDESRAILSWRYEGNMCMQ